MHQIPTACLISDESTRGLAHVGLQCVYAVWRSRAEPLAGQTPAVESGCWGMEYYLTIELGA